MSLRDLVLAGATGRDTKKQILIPLITQYLNAKDDVPPLFPFWIRDQRHKPSRKDKRFHPSNIDHDFCGRRWCIEQYDLAPVVEKPIDAKTRRIFEHGDMVHSMVQMWFAQMGRLYGMWECTYCRGQWWDVSAPHCNNNDCNEAPTVYKEVPIDHAGTNVLGHADGEVITGTPETPVHRYALEIKSAHSQSFAGVQLSPMERHKYQAYQYLWIRSRKDGRMKHLGELPREHPLEGAIVLYVNKETGEMREHLLQLTDKSIEEYIDPVHHEMAGARAFNPKKLKTLPSRLCPDEDTGNVRGCPFVVSCFHQLPPKWKQ